MARYPFVHDTDSIVTNATYQELESPKEQSNAIVSFDAVIGLDVSNIPTTVEIGVKQGSRRVVLARKVPSAAAVSVEFTAKFWCSGEWRAYVGFYGATLGDTIKASFLGYVDSKTE